jgi:hypothetical protein
MGITLLIRYFNILSATVAAFFAVYGAIALFGKKSNLNIFRRNLFIQAFCVAALFAFVLEGTLFNFPHYLKYFADGEFHTLEVSPLDSTVILTSDGTLAEKFTDKDSASSDSAVAAASAVDSVSGGASVSDNGNRDSAGVWGGVVFKKLDRRVTSVFIEPVFDSAESIAAAIRLVDKAGTHVRIAIIHKGLPHTNHIPVQVCGKVSELRIALSGAGSAGASLIAINRQIPLYFSGLRLVVVSALFFAIIVFVYKPLRARAAYFLFDYRFDSSSKKQNAVYALSVVSLILFSWVCAYTSVVEENPQARQYNKYLVDAIIAGRTYLDAGNPEKMLKAPNPYDLRWLDENKYLRGEDWMADWIFYKGKFYCYFGAVPALMLYVPYKLITGNYLSNHGGIFVFAAASIILLAQLWRFFVKKYMPDTRFAFYLLSFLTLFFASGWFCPLRFTRFYSIVSAGGFMFVVAGILLLFEAVDRLNGERAGGKPDRSKLFFASMCLALAVGCRPNLLFASLIVPVILWKYRLWRYLPFIAVPYVAVAIPICLYNYARFGSIFDFGFNYNMTNLNTAAWSLLNPIGKLINTFRNALSYLFAVNRYSFFFPYVEVLPQHDKVFWSIVNFYDRGYGMLNYPIVFCLYLFFKSIAVKVERAETFYVSAAFLAIAAVLISVDSYLAGFSGRYSFDFAVFIIFPSLFCAYHWCYGGGAQTPENQIPFRIRQKITYILLTFSIFVGLFLFAGTVTNEAMSGNPALYRYLRQSLVFMGVV